MSTNPKSFTVDVPVGVCEAFSEHIDEQGYTKWRAVMGALKTYMTLPAEVQVFVNNPNTTVKQVQKMIIQSYGDKLRLELLETLTPHQQAVLIETVKKTAAQLSRKK